MATIYEKIEGLKPKISKVHKQFIVEKYAENAGVHEITTTKFMKMQWQPFAWAAILGLVHDKCSEIVGDTADSAFNYSVIFKNANDVFYTIILCLVARKGYEVLKDPSQLNSIISQYAEGGFQLINTMLREYGDDYFNNSDNFLKEVLNRNTGVSEQVPSINKSKLSRAEPDMVSGESDEF